MSNRRGRQEIEFRQEWCSMLHDHISNGFKFQSFASVIGIGKSTLYAMAKKYPALMRVKTGGGK